MRKVFAFYFTTIDGVAEFPEYPERARSEPEEVNPVWTPYMPGIDTLFLGRHTYELWSDYWPRQKDEASAGEWMKEFSRFADRAEKVVFSKSLPSATWPNSRIVRGSIENEVARLRKVPGATMAVGGGPRLLQSFLALDLVDDLFLSVSPVLAGHGKPLFRVKMDPDHAPDQIPIGAPDRHDFRLVEARPVSDGELFLHYERMPKEP